MAISQACTSTGGARLGLHTVKVVGYGTDANGCDYWASLLGHLWHEWHLPHRG